MSIRLISSRPGMANTLREVVRLFFSDGLLVEDGEALCLLTLDFFQSDEGCKVVAVFSDGAAHHRGEATGWGSLDGNQVKRLARLAVYRALIFRTGKAPGPWGILTGVRPSKILHRLWDLGWQEEDIIRHLTGDYAMTEEKARLLIAVTRRQRPVLPTPDEARRKVSVYVGIPFCPTRCLYCSFPAYPIKANVSLVPAYLAALHREIEAVGRLLRARGLLVQSLYLGGGTPTSLAPDDLDRLLDAINRQLRSAATEEFTVEGGRPDTLDGQRLQVIRRAGVDRLSINPQTFDEGTLQRIGRRHSPAEVGVAMERARALGFATINMDLILGLPGETTDHVAKTLEHIGFLRPENLTVHTLAVKRASRLNEEKGQWELAGSGEVERMQEAVQDFAREKGYVPYYLYRQKQILANLENVGYCLPGHESVYNIQVMEERQTIIGLGAGAASKWVRPADWTLTSTANPRDVQNYIERIEELIAAKTRSLSVDNPQEIG